METIALKEAAAIVGKDESTIRKFFNKPENKAHRQIIRGKLYVSKDLLVKQYVGEKNTTSAQSGVPGNSGERSASSPNEKHAVDAAMQALISQLEAKDNQISDLLARLHESNSNHARALQQNNPAPDDGRQENGQAVQVLADQLRRKDEEIAGLNIKLQEASKPKSTRQDYILVGVILVLAAALVVVMLINKL